MEETIEETFTEYTFTRKLHDILDTGMVDKFDDVDLLVSFETHRRVTEFCSWEGCYLRYCGRNWHIRSDSTQKGNDVTLLVKTIF